MGRWRPAARERTIDAAPELLISPVRLRGLGGLRLRGLLPVEWVEDLVATVPDATMVTLDAGHEIHVARPADFLDAVQAFLVPSEPGS